MVWWLVSNLLWGMCFSSKVYIAFLMFPDPGYGATSVMLVQSALCIVYWERLPSTKVCVMIKLLLNTVLAISLSLYSHCTERDSVHCVIWCYCVVALFQWWCVHSCCCIWKHQSRPEPQWLRESDFWGDRMKSSFSRLSRSTSIKELQSKFSIMLFMCSCTKDLYFSVSRPRQDYALATPTSPAHVDLAYLKRSSSRWAMHVYTYTVAS